MWDRHPFLLGVRPLKVFVDGILSEDLASIASSGQYILPYAPPVNFQSSGPTSCQGALTQNIVIKGVTIHPFNSTDITFVINNGVIVIQNGVITCMDVATVCVDPPGADIYTIDGGIAIPGIVSTGSSVGQFDVQTEPETHDGTADTTFGLSLNAADGIKLNEYYGRIVKAAFAGGVREFQFQWPLF